MAASYISPTDFRLPANPPIYPNDPILQNILTNYWQTMQAIIQAFVVDCGIAQRLATQWPLLNGSSSTIVSANVNRYYETATENIAYGAPVNLAAAGMRNANATTNAKPADGYCSTIGGVLLGTVGEFILANGAITGLAGLVKGTRYYLSTVAGTYTAIAPVAAGNIEQYVGFAISATELFFYSHYWIQH